MNNNRLSFPNGFEKTEVRWEKIKIKLAHNEFISAVTAFTMLKMEYKHNRRKQNDSRIETGDWGTERLPQR